MAICTSCSLMKPWNQFVSEKLCRDCCTTIDKQRFNQHTSNYEVYNQMQSLIRRQSTNIHQSVYELNRQGTFNADMMNSFHELHLTIRNLYDEAQGVQRRLNRQSCVFFVAAILVGAAVFIAICAQYMGNM